MDFTKVAEHFENKANAALHLTDPVAWARDRLEVYFWSKQQEILRALVEHKNVAVKTTFSVGKTMSAAMALGWWIDTRGADALVVSTAPTFRQVNSLLWEELRKAHVKGKLPGRILQEPRWMMKHAVDGRSTDVIVGMGVKPAEGATDGGSATEMSALQGLHRPDGILAVIDEACGVSEAIFAGIQRITTNPDDRVLALGNPTNGNTKFGQLWRDKPEDWHLITISAFDTPNFTGEPVAESLKKSMPDPVWVEFRRKEWGEDSNRWKSEILAEFPDTSDDGLFNMSLVRAAVDNDEFQRSTAAAPVMGVDVARFGSDSNTVFVRYGQRVEYLDSWQGLDTVESAQRIARHAEDIGCLNIRVDAVGVGAGVVDNLVRLLPDASIYEMHGSAASPDSLKWHNARAYWYDDLRSRLARGELTLPDHKQLIDEFGVIRYTIKGSAMLIESKEELKRRGIKSPDYLDAVVYACADMTGGIEGDQYLTEEDVFNDDDFTWEEMLLGGPEPFSFAPY